MKIFRTYIQQLSYDGLTYKKGEVIDLMEKFNIGCVSFPYKNMPEAKELPKRDWVGEDGLDVYIPSTIPMKEYDLEVVFIYKGTEEEMSNDISSFIKFIYGRNKGAVGARLAIYDEHVAIGRKDIRVLSIDNDVFQCTDSDPDAIAEFKVKFQVCDPVTEVMPVYTSLPDGSKMISDLKF